MRIIEIITSDGRTREISEYELQETFFNNRFNPNVEITIAGWQVLMRAISAWRYVDSNHKRIYSTGVSRPGIHQKSDNKTGKHKKD